METIVLSDGAKGRNNNLDVMRFIAALLVIYCHAFPLTMGKAAIDYLGQFSHGQINFGGIAVGLFFCAGGYLIAKSIDRVKSTKSYFVSRCLRIFPLLIAVTAILTFIAGPFLTTLSPGEYFTNSQTYFYLLNGLLIPVHNLPGVFTNSIFDPTVNGPLWTLPIEFACYIFCWIVFKRNLLNKKRYPIVLAVCLLGTIGFYYGFSQNDMIQSVVRPALLFAIGMGFYVFQDRIRLNVWIGLGLIVPFILLFWLGQSFIGMIFLFPYIIFSIAFATRHRLGGFGKYGEFSYGVYLWGWPAQQMLCQLWGGTMPVWLNFLLASLIALVLAVITYYLIEKPTLKIKK